MSSETAVPRAARGTRPRNRRAQVVAAAVGLFSTRGYDHVGMGDIAEAVGIGPSALYRHFSGKQSLLAEVIEQGFAPVAELVGALDLADRTDALARLGSLALDERHVGVLWWRESRHLDPEGRARLSEVLDGIGAQLIDRVGAVRPGVGARGAALIAWSMLAVLTSPSFHRLDLPRPRYDALLAELVGTVLDVQLPAGFDPPLCTAAPGRLVPASRREALLVQAVRMFADQGYAAVGIEDIGNAVGIAGPSVYNHFTSKLDLLTTAFERGAAALLLNLSAVYRTATDAGEALRGLVDGYITFAMAHPGLIGLLTTEVDHLPEEQRHAARRAQHDYVSEWVHLMRTVRPGMDATTARIRTHAAISVVNDAAHMAARQRDPRAAAVLHRICTGLLDLPPAAAGPMGEHLSG